MRGLASLWPAPLSHPSRRRGRGMSRETSLLSPSLTLRPRWARTPGCSGSDLDFIEPYPGLSADQSGTPQCATKRRSDLLLHMSVPRQRWVPNRRKQTAAPLSSKKGTGRERSFYIEKAHSARRFPLKDNVCVLLAQTKDAKIVCVIGFQIMRTRIHTQS